MGQGPFPVPLDQNVIVEKLSEVNVPGPEYAMALLVLP
jgi:hypothetical protein